MVKFKSYYRDCLCASCTHVDHHNKHQLISKKTNDHVLYAMLFDDSDSFSLEKNVIAHQEKKLKITMENANQVFS